MSQVTLDVITCSLQPPENTPLAPPFTRHSSWSACPLLYICVFVGNFCFPSLGLPHLTSGAAALKLFSFNFYGLQNSEESTELLVSVSTTIRCVKAKIKVKIHQDTGNVLWT